MYSNANITIVNSYYDNLLDREIYKKTVIKEVFWESQEGYARQRAGIISDDKAKVMIPKHHESDKELVSKADWDNLDDKANHYTISEGSLVVNGIVDYEIKSTKDLKDYFTITTVVFNDFGSERMRHWEVLGK